MDGYVESCDSCIWGWVRAKSSETATAVEILCNGKFLMEWPAEMHRSDLDYAFGFRIVLASVGTDGDVLQLRSKLSGNLINTYGDLPFSVVRNQKAERLLGASFPAATRLQLSKEIKQWNWKIGEHTYGRPTILEHGFAPFEIGRYCSIGPNVTIILANHRTDLMTTYPFKGWSSFWPKALEVIASDHETRGGVKIGHDVWLGSGSTVLAGVSIGSGSVIGAGSIITKSIEPYSVVVGAPGRVLRKRFCENTITRLLRINWWDWPDEEVERELARLLTESPEALLEYGEARLKKLPE